MFFSRNSEKTFRMLLLCIKFACQSHHVNNPSPSLHFAHINKLLAVIKRQGKRTNEMQLFCSSVLLGWIFLAMAIYNYIRSRLCVEIIAPSRADRRWGKGLLIKHLTESLQPRATAGTHINTSKERKLMHEQTFMQMFAPL